MAEVANKWGENYLINGENRLSTFKKGIRPQLHTIHTHKKTNCRWITLHTVKGKTFR